jgi:hypothetical protein
MPLLRVGDVSVDVPPEVNVEISSSGRVTLNFHDFNGEISLLPQQKRSPGDAASSEEAVRITPLVNREKPSLNEMTPTHMDAVLRPLPCMRAGQTPTPRDTCRRLGRLRLHGWRCSLGDAD